MDAHDDIAYDNVADNDVVHNEIAYDDEASVYDIWPMYDESHKI